MSVLHSTQEIHTSTATHVCHSTPAGKLSDGIVAETSTGYLLYSTLKLNSWLYLCIPTSQGQQTVPLPVGIAATCTLLAKGLMKYCRPKWITFTKQAVVSVLVAIPVNWWGIGYWLLEFWNADNFSRPIVWVQLSTATHDGLAME